MIGSRLGVSRARVTTLQHPCSGSFVHLFGRVMNLAQQVCHVQDWQLCLLTFWVICPWTFPLHRFRGISFAANISCTFWIFWYYMLEMWDSLNSRMQEWRQSVSSYPTYLLFHPWVYLSITKSYLLNRLKKLQDIFMKFYMNIKHH